MQDGRTESRKKNDIPLADRDKELAAWEYALSRDDYYFFPTLITSLQEVPEPHGFVEGWGWELNRDVEAYIICKLGLGAEYGIQAVPPIAVVEMEVKKQMRRHLRAGRRLAREDLGELERRVFGSWTRMDFHHFDRTVGRKRALEMYWERIERRSAGICHSKGDSV